MEFFQETYPIQCDDGVMPYVTMSFALGFLYHDEERRKREQNLRNASEGLPVPSRNDKTALLTLMPTGTVTAK